MGIKSITILISELKGLSNDWVGRHMGGLQEMSSPPVCHATDPYLRKPLALMELKRMIIQGNEYPIPMAH